MPKASIKLPDGTSVVIEGSPEEVAKVLSLYGGASNTSGTAVSSRKKEAKQKRITLNAKGNAKVKGDAGDTFDLSEIINQIRDCDEAEVIEAKILDKVGQVNRILLPLYIVHEYLDNAHGLTSGEVSKITTDLGVPVKTSNASTALSGSASRYVIGDIIRKQGQPVRYKLSRRGVQYLKGVLEGNKDGE